MALPTKIGKYELQGVIGQGGMGIVYKAFDPLIRRTVAIKTVVKSRLEPSASPRALERFRREAQAAGGLLHPGIVAVYDYGEDADIAFIVMECVRGKSLREHLSNEKRYDLPEAWQILSQLLDAIGYSHTQGVVHRDLKPANILINDDGRIKISDFGIARVDTGQVSEHGEIVGTLYYMAPEQVRGENVDHRADLYSVGIICYQLLTGRRPFAGTPMEVMNQVLDFIPVDPSRLNPDLPRDLDRIIRKALAKRPEERFQSARELADRLRETFDPVRRHAPAAPLRESAPPADPPADGRTGGLREPGRRISVVRFPRVPVPDIDLSDADPRAEPCLPKPRVLFVDDEERILNALQALLKASFEVITAPGGEQALEALKAGPMDVVVTDQRMPGMPGVELLRRAREIAPDTVRILLTGYSDLASIVGSINEGEIYRFVGKPWDNEELATTLREAVSVSRALRDARSAPIAPVEVDGTLLVVEAEPNMIRVVREIFGRRHKVRYAPSGEAALELMVQEEVSVLLADVDANPEQMATLLKLLKQERPRVLAIVATGASDSELVIELINQAQIYRFLNKPLNPLVLAQHMESALTRHWALRRTPATARQQDVEASPPAIRQSAFGRTLLDKLRLLRKGAAGP
jgi:serine/threonine-protein kinase